jgi:hypothetical protein
MWVWRKKNKRRRRKEMKAAGRMWEVKEDFFYDYNNGWEMNSASQFLGSIKF